MIFGESANTTEKDTTTIKTADPKYSMPRWCPEGLTRSQKRKLQRLRAKESQEKEAEKTFNDTHPLYPPPQKKWRPKAVEKKQTATEIESQSAQGADCPSSACGPSVIHQEVSRQPAPGADRPAPVRGPSGPRARTVRRSPGSLWTTCTRSGPSGPRARTVRRSPGSLQRRDNINGRGRPAGRRPGRLRGFSRMPR
jgi:hypothetical protein